MLTVRSIVTSFTARWLQRFQILLIARRSDSRSGESPASTSADRYIDRRPPGLLEARPARRGCSRHARHRRRSRAARRAAESARLQRPTELDEHGTELVQGPGAFNDRGSRGGVEIVVRQPQVARRIVERSSPVFQCAESIEGFPPAVGRHSRCRRVRDCTFGYPRADWRSPVLIRASTCLSSASRRMAGVSSTLSPACTAPDIAWPLERSRKMVVIDRRSTACRSRPRNTCTTDPFSRPSIEPRSTATWPSSTETTTPVSRGDRPSALRLRNSVRAVPANSSMRAVRMTGGVVTAAESAVTAAPIEVSNLATTMPLKVGRFSGRTINHHQRKHSRCRARAPAHVRPPGLKDLSRAGSDAGWKSGLGMAAAGAPMGCRLSAPPS